MKMIAAMQVRSSTVRGAPPRAWEGGGGSSGWTRCHNGVGQQPVGEGGHGPGSSHRQAHRPSEVPECPLRDATVPGRAQSLAASRLWSEDEDGKGLTVGFLQNHAVAARLDEAGVPLRTDFYGPRTHTGSTPPSVGSALARLRSGGSPYGAAPASSCSRPPERSCSAWRSTWREVKPNSSGISLANPPWRSDLEWSR
jgi:hypothetical protein